MYALFRPTLRQLFRGWTAAVYRWRTSFMQLGERTEPCRLCRIDFITDCGDVFCIRCEDYALECQNCGCTGDTVIRGWCAACDPDGRSDLYIPDFDQNANIDDDDDDDDDDDEQQLA